MTADHFLGEQDNKLLLLLGGQFFDLLHDFSGTHVIKLTMFHPASKPAPLRQFGRQFARRSGRRTVAGFGRVGFRMEMF